MTWPGDNGATGRPLPYSSAADRARDRKWPGGIEAAPQQPTCRTCDSPLPGSRPGWGPRPAVLTTSRLDLPGQEDPEPSAECVTKLHLPRPQSLSVGGSKEVGGGVRPPRTGSPIRRGWEEAEPPHRDPEPGPGWVPTQQLAVGCHGSCPAPSHIHGCQPGPPGPGWPRVPPSALLMVPQLLPHCPSPSLSACSLPLFPFLFLHCPTSAHPTQ